MCGIFLHLGEFIERDMRAKFKKTENRGPDSSRIYRSKLFSEEKNNCCEVIMGFHRLKINDLSNNGMQPMRVGNCVMVCNGEIYNFRELADQHDLELKTRSDCEIILHLYKKFGIEDTVDMLDGVFALAIHDFDLDEIIIARDPFGVRPLFIGGDENNITICSELKSLLKNVENINPLCVCIHESCEYDCMMGNCVHTFAPGTIQRIKLKKRTFSHDISLPDNYSKYSEFSKRHVFEITTHKYHELNISADSEILESEILGPTDSKLDPDAETNIRDLLVAAVRKRMLSDRPIGCLLSGGLDSSLVSALVAREMGKWGGPSKLHTFSIGMEGGTDLSYASMVAKHIGSTHHEIVHTAQEFLDAIPEVIKTIESYDTTSVRASVGNYLVAKYIKENTDIAVVFNGDGADEVCNGYIYNKSAPTPEDAQRECQRLVNDIHMFDVLRSDRSVSSKWGLESRTPFLDKKFVKYYFSLNASLTDQNNTPITPGDITIEKHLLRKSFNNDNLLPSEVLWRKKEAFSDGVSSLQDSWCTIIQKYVEKKISIMELNQERIITKNRNLTKEALYYLRFFDKYYTRESRPVIPYYWMPKWCGPQSDPSARVLDNY